MEKTNTNPLSKYFFLSGERLKRAKHVYRQDIALGLVAGLFAAIAAQIYPEQGMVIWFGFVVAAAIWSLFRAARGETFFQFRLKEVQASRSEADKALQDLYEHAASLKGSDEKG